MWIFKDFLNIHVNGGIKSTKRVCILVEKEPDCTRVEVSNDLYWPACRKMIPDKVDELALPREFPHVIAVVLSILNLLMKLRYPAHSCALAANTAPNALLLISGVFTSALPTFTQYCRFSTGTYSASWYRLTMGLNVRHIFMVCPNHKMLLGPL